jgi:peptide subunit release factor RF-3
MIDESDLEILELEEEESDEDAFSAGRLVTVALGGALLSLGVYYVYQQLSPERKATLKKQASGLIANQIHQLTDMGDFDEDDDDEVD